MTRAADRSRSPRRTTEPSDSLKKLKALVVNLERRPDRRTRCETMLKKEVPWLQYEMFPASDGSKMEIPTNEISMSWNTKNNSLYGQYEDVHDSEGKLVHTKEDFEAGVEYKLSPGERGCAHSHRRMWEVVAKSQEPMLLLEDDVELVFERNGGGQSSGELFTERLARAFQEAEKVGAEGLYLGWAGYREGNYLHKEEDESAPKSDILRKSEYVWTTVGYILWPEGARKLLAAASPMNQPVDNFMGWECREGRFNAYVCLDEGDADEIFAGGIVGQVDFQGDSDIKKSDGGDQNDDPTAFLVSTAAAQAGC